MIGPIDKLLSGLSKHTSSCSGLTFGALSLLDGSREGEVMFYENGKYPFKPIGTVLFFWKPKETSLLDERKVWMWTHPSFYQQVINALVSTFHLYQVTPTHPLPVKENGNSESQESDVPTKRMKMQAGEKSPKKVEELKLETRNVPFDRTPKFNSSCGHVQMVLLKDTLNRFRLTGPLSQAVLREALQLAHSDKSRPHSDETPSSLPEVGENREIHHNFWRSISNLSSPAELSPRIILSLTVKDPRLQIPDKRTKAVTQTTGSVLWLWYSKLLAVYIGTHSNITDLFQINKLLHLHLHHIRAVFGIQLSEILQLNPNFLQQNSIS